MWNFPHLDLVMEKFAHRDVEFAERKVLPEYANLKSSKIKSFHRRDGFETGNADLIFESTFSNQVKK